MKVLSVFLALCFLCSIPVSAKPNFILIVTDNLGYGDVGCFGSKVNRTPNLDQMAAEGMKLTGFYVGSSVCTPSRAAFMTGCYPARVSMELSGTRRLVLQPVAQKGLAPGETTIAEVLKSAGYSTMCIGKWHLGDQPAFLPTRQGFDSWLGVPYSEDMVATTAPRLGEMWPPVPLVKNETVIDAPVDPNSLTKIYTEAAVSFIEENRENPFFLYLPHAVPGSSKTAFASEEFRKKSQNGTYGACIEELDWSMGEIFDCLKKQGLDENTLVVWTSDNGAFHGRREPPFGQNVPLRGTGGTPYEGGFRVPCIARWPDGIPAGRETDELVTSMDLLPTFAALAEADFVPERKIDGKNSWPIISGEEGAKSLHEVFYYYRVTQLRAVRSGKWKLHLPVNRNAFRPTGRGVYDQIQLYNLEADLSETTNLADQHPDIVARLSKLAEKGRETLGDLHRTGTEQRPAGWLDNVTSLRLPDLPNTRGFPTDGIPLISPGLGFLKFTDDAPEGWKNTSAVSLIAGEPDKLFISPVEGDGVLYTETDKAATLKTGTEFSGYDLHLEFLTTAKSSVTIQVSEDEKFTFPGSHPSARPAGEWQSIDITSRNSRLEVSLNGKVVDRQDTDDSPAAISITPAGSVSLRNSWIRD